MSLTEPQTFLNSIPSVGAVLASTAAALAGILSAIALRKPRLRAAINQRQDERDLTEEIRLSQTLRKLSAELDRFRALGFASSLLVFSQFVVGGLLTATFATKTLGESIVGILGLVVLGSSLVNQHFRPDLLKKISAEKIRRLKALRRRLEDELYVETRQNPSDARLIEMRLYATKALEEIDDIELEAIKNDQTKK